MNSVNVEGWGLYAEAEAQPVPAARGPAHRAPEYRLLRAARAMLDPGLQAVPSPRTRPPAYCARTSCSRRRCRCRRSIRYTFRAPGQATSYFVGSTAGSSRSAPTPSTRSARPSTGRSSTTSSSPRGRRPVAAAESGGRGVHPRPEGRSARSRPPTSRRTREPTVGVGDLGHRAARFPHRMGPMDRDAARCSGRAHVGLLLVWGYAAALAAGGWLCWLELAERDVLAALVGLGVSGFLLRKPGAPAIASDSAPLGGRAIVLRAGLALFCIGLLGLSYALGLFDARYQGGDDRAAYFCMPRRFSRPALSTSPSASGASRATGGRASSRRCCWSSPRSST